MESLEDKGLMEQVQAELNVLRDHTEKIIVDNEELTQVLSDEKARFSHLMAELELLLINRGYTAKLRAKNDALRIQLITVRKELKHLVQTYAVCEDDGTNHDLVDLVERHARLQ